MEMTTLSKNIKTIRRHLRYTQMEMAGVLNIGFRTYVRYEAGQRDAPVSVLVKLAQLGNLSLDRLLTTEIREQELAVAEADIAKSGKLEVIGGSLQEGWLVFKELRDNYWVCTKDNERKLLTLYRKMNPSARNKCLLDSKRLLKNTRQRQGKDLAKKGVSRKTLKAKSTAKLKRISQAIKTTTLKG